VSAISARQTIMLVAVFVITSIAFIALDNRQALDPLKTGVRDLVVPVTDLLSGVGDGSGNQTALQQDYDDLKAKYDKLQADYALLLVNAREADQLRELLNLQQSQPNLSIVPARVLYPDPTSTQKLIIIDKGSNDGIKPGMAVTNPNFFIGLVTEVDPEQSRVMLAIDATQSIGAELMNSHGVGIAYGMWQRAGRMEIRHVPRTVETQEGEYVTTACATEARTAGVPCGLVIGIVSGPPVLDNQGDTQTIPVMPAANFDDLSVVAVIVADGNDAE
jgi:rod shape-determining protein MreC